MDIVLSKKGVKCAVFKISECILPSGNLYEIFYITYLIVRILTCESI